MQGKSVEPVEICYCLPSYTLITLITVLILITVLTSIRDPDHFEVERYLRL